MGWREKEIKRWDDLLHVQARRAQTTVGFSYLLYLSRSHRSIIAMNCDHLFQHKKDAVFPCIVAGSSSSRNLSDLLARERPRSVHWTVRFFAPHFYLGAVFKSGRMVIVPGNESERRRLGQPASNVTISVAFLIHVQYNARRKPRCGLRIRMIASAMRESVLAGEPKEHMPSEFSQTNINM